MAIKRKITDEELKELNFQEREHWPMLLYDQIEKQIDEEVDAMIKTRNKRLLPRRIATTIMGVLSIAPPIAFTLLSITNPILLWAWVASLIIFIALNLSEE